MFFNQLIMAALHLVWNLDRTNPWLWTTKWGIWINCMSSVTCVGDYRSPRGMISSLIKNSMVSSSQSSTLLSSSSVSTPERQKQMSAIFSTFKLRKSWGRRAKVKGSHLLWARGGCSSVLDGSPAPAPCSDDSPPSWTCACPPAPTQTHTHHTFSFMAENNAQEAACTDFITKISDLKKKPSCLELIDYNYSTKRENIESPLKMCSVWGQVPKMTNDTDVMHLDQ